MKYHFDPGEMKLLCNAFEMAWHTLEKETQIKNCDAVRDLMGRAIVDLAMEGKLNEAHLASYAAYKGRCFLGTKVASISTTSGRAKP